MTTYGDDGSLRRETDFAADLAATLGCIVIARPHCL